MANRYKLIHEGNHEIIHDAFDHTGLTGVPATYTDEMAQEAVGMMIVDIVHDMNWLSGQIDNNESNINNVVHDINWLSGNLAEIVQDSVGQIFDTSAISGDIAFYYDDVNNLISGRIRKSIDIKGSVSGTQTFNLSLYGCITLTVTNTTSFDIVGSYEPDKMYVSEVLITNGGAHVLTWPSMFKFPGGATTFTVSGLDSLTLVIIDGGSTCRVLSNGKDIK